MTKVVRVRVSPSAPFGSFDFLVESSEYLVSKLVGSGGNGAVLLIVANSLVI